MNDMWIAYAGVQFVGIAKICSNRVIRDWAICCAYMCLVGLAWYNLIRINLYS